MIEIVFETHAITEDNEAGLATGWNPGRLSARGRTLAKELGKRRRDDAIAAVFASDLERAAETARIAFAETAQPVLLDWRLRECDYGSMNGTPTANVHERSRYLEMPYPRGESWREAVERVGRFLRDLPLRWDGKRVLVIGHMATYYGLEHWINGIPLEWLIETPFEWQEGWEYRFPLAVDGRLAAGESADRES